MDKDIVYEKRNSWYSFEHVMHDPSTETYRVFEPERTSPKLKKLTVNEKGSFLFVAWMKG